MAQELANLDDYTDVLDMLDREPPESVILNDENPVVAGRAVRVEEAMTKYGPTKILVLERHGQEFSVWLLHTVLRNELERRRPKTGDKVAIRYLGKGEDYVRYKVAVVPSAGTALEFDSPEALPRPDIEEAEVVDKPEDTSFPVGQEPGWNSPVSDVPAPKWD